MPGWNPFRKETNSPGPGPKQEPINIRPSVRGSKSAQQRARDTGIDNTAQDLTNLYEEKERLDTEYRKAEDEYREAVGAAQTVGFSRRAEVERQLIDARIETQRLDEEIRAAQPNVLDLEHDLVEARQKADRLGTDLLAARQRERSIEDQLQKIQLDLDLKRRELDHTRWELQFADDNLDKLEDERRDLESQLDTALNENKHRDIRDFRRRISRVSENFQRIGRERATHRATIDRLEREIADSERLQTQINGELPVTQQAAYDLETETQSARDEVIRLENQLRSERAAVRGTVEPLEQELASKQEEVKELDKELEDLRRRDQSRANLETLRKRKEDIRSALNSVNNQISRLEGHASRHYPRQFRHLKR